MNVNLTADSANFIQGLVTSGQYPSAEEAVSDGVRLLMSQQHLREKIHQGVAELDAGEGIDGKQVFAELRQRVKHLTEQAK